MKKSKILSFILCIFICFYISGCKNKNNEEEIIEERTYHNDNFPSFIINDVKAKSGDEVVMNVSLKDNPGFLTMALKINYDENVMTLNEVKSCDDYSDYTYVGPTNMASGCTASLFGVDLPEKIIDGNLFELHFSISKEAKKGKYEVYISRPDNGGIVNVNKEEIIINEAIGIIDISK